MRTRSPLARRIDLGLEAEPAAVQGDREALRILVRNLVDNAVRYTPEGGRVRVRTAPAGRRGAALEVIDTGPGIPPSDRERAFDRFYRRASCTARAAAAWGSPSSRRSPIGTAPRVSLDDAPDGGLQVDRHALPA